MIIPVRGVGEIGIISDVPADEIPLHAWTNGRNVRFREGAVEKFLGHLEVYATPNVAPYWLLPVPTASTYFWLYAGLAKVGATDGTTHANITRIVGGDYLTDANVGWTGTIIEGKVVINNGADVPQMWTPALANALSALTAWNAAWLARSMRSIKRYLVALDITKSGTRYPQMIKWSDQAATGAVPASWDETSTTNDAGEWTLPDVGGILLDSIPLRDDLVLYKESQTWLMQYVGGVEIFRFTRRFSEIGMLARKCAVEFFSGKHVAFTGEDLILHDGQQAQSLLARRMKSFIAGNIDPNRYQRSFVVANFVKTEVWACFPETGNADCTLALVWNWNENTISVRNLPKVAFISSGIVDPSTAADTWGGITGTWATINRSWEDRLYDPTKRRLLMAVPGTTKLQKPDESNQFDGTNITSFVEKQAIGFPLKVDAPPDYTTEKIVRGIWPRISGLSGGVVNVYLGTQDRVGGQVIYQSPFPFVIGTTEYVDPDLNNASKLHALKFESTGNVHWKLHGYDVDVVPAGQHGNR